MKMQSNHRCATTEKPATATAVTRLMLCTRLGDFMRPCIICPPSSGKTGSRFRRVHQQLTSMRKKNRNIASGGYDSTASAGIYPCTN